MKNASKSRTRRNSKSIDLKTPILKRGFYNDRFHLNEASTLLNTTENPSKSKNLEKLRLPHLSIPEKSRSDRSRSQNPSISEDSLSDSLSDSLNLVTSLWTLKQIPLDWQETSKSCLLQLPRSKATQIISSELKSLKEGSSPLQQMLKSITSREASLNSITELNDYLKSSPWLSLKEVHLQCAELLHGHRLFTLNAIESISKWRSFLTNSLKVHNLPVGFLECKFEGVNYLLKMGTDLDFLKQSEFAKVLSFSEEHDPLLVAPSIPIGKNERGRKRDVNYFLDEGSVIVPIPSFLMARVKEAEDFIRNEEEFVRFQQETTPEKLALLFSPQVLEEIVEEEIGKEIKMVVEKVREEVDEEKRKNRKERKENRKANNLVKDVVEKVIEEEIFDIVQMEVLMEKKDVQVKENEKLAEIIFNSLLDDLANDMLPLASTSYSKSYESARQKKEQELKSQSEVLDKLSKDLFVNLFEDFLKLSSKDLALETLKEFRRAREEESSLYVVKSPLMDEIGLDFATLEYFSDLSEMRWIPLHLQEEQLIDVLNEYYSVSPDENEAFLPSIDELMIETTKLADPCWYWAVKGTLILGFLVFSTDCFNKTGKKIIVHHVSSLYWNKYSDILASATQHLWKVAPSDEIRINLFTPAGNDLTPDVKRVFTEQGFKWKATCPVNDSKNQIVVLGKSKNRKSSNPALMNFCLKCSEVIRCNEERVDARMDGEHFKRVGNRQNMLHALLALFGKIENNDLKVSEKVQNKLQGIVNSLFKTMNETQSFSFPSMTGTTSDQQLKEFLAVQGLTFEDTEPSKKTSASVLELKFRWIGCTNFSLQIRGRSYRYLRFRSSNLNCIKLADDIEFYIIPTELPNLQAFFMKAADLSQSLSRTLNQGLDMFCFVEQVAGVTTETVKEIWVPCFNFESSERIEWIKGYEITPQNEGVEKIFVSSCDEKVQLNMNLFEIPDGLLYADNKYGPVFINEFIFGLLYTKGDKILDIPLFTCLVKPEDWVKV